MLHFRSPNSTIKIPSKRTPQPHPPRFLNGAPTDTPVSRAFTHPLMTHLSLEVSGKGYVIHVPQLRPYGDRCCVSRSIHSFICHSRQSSSSPTKRGQTYGHRPRNRTRTEDRSKMRCSLVPQGDRLGPCCHYPVPCSPHHDTYHLGVIRAPLAFLCRSNPHLGIPSTPVTASHVT